MLSENIDSIENVIDLILHGTLDDDLDNLTLAIRERKDTISRRSFYTINVGDKVNFISGRPKYLIGQTATVVAKKQKNLSIEFDDKQAVRKYGYGPVTCPPSMVEKVV